MEAKLVALAPAEIINTEFNLQLPVTIGRGRDAKIKLVHGQISRLHCEVYEDNGELKARDLGSLNGTFVDGERVSDAALKPGGMLNIGSVTFRAVYGTMPVETDDSAVEFGGPRITDTVGTTSTVMEEAFPGFGNIGEAETAAADDDDLGMFDFTVEPSPAKAAAPSPVEKPAAPPVPAAAMPEPIAAEADDELGMFDFTEEPAPARAVAPAPIAKPAPLAPQVSPAVAPPLPVVAPQDNTATISMPAPSKAAPSKAPAAPVIAVPAAPAFVPPAIPAAPAKAADVDDWLNLAESTEEAAPATDDDDLQSFFGNMK